MLRARQHAKLVEDTTRPLEHLQLRERAPIGLRIEIVSTRRTPQLICTTWRMLIGEKEGYVADEEHHFSFAAKMRIAVTLTYIDSS